MVVMFRGRRACTCLAEWIPVLEKEAVRRKIIKKNVDIAQLIGGVAASGGTHRTGGAFDVWQTSKAFVRLCRDMGADASWHRKRSQGPWSPHTHGVLTGCPHNGPARYQITEVKNNQNGLRGNARDDGPRPLSGRTYKQGIAWAKAQGKPTQPTPKPPSGVDKMDPRNYGPGKNGAHVTWLGERLVAHGFGKYDVGPGPTWGPADEASVKAFQRAQGWKGDDADGFPGKETLKRLAANP